MPTLLQPRPKPSLMTTAPSTYPRGAPPLPFHVSQIPIAICDYFFRPLRPPLDALADCVDVFVRPRSALHSSQYHVCGRLSGVRLTQDRWNCVHESDASAKPEHHKEKTRPPRHKGEPTQRPYPLQPAALIVASDHLYEQTGSVSGVRANTPSPPARHTGLQCSARPVSGSNVRRTSP